MAIPLFHIRGNGEEYDLESTYEGEPSYFSIKIHHGGKFTKFPGRKYVNGTVDFVDSIDIDQFSVHEIDSIMLQLGYADKIMYYHFLIPESDLDFGLRALGNDQDVINLSSYIAKNKVICVYTEHGETKLKTYFTSPTFSKVRIEEITENVSFNEGRGKKSSKSPCAKRLMLEWGSNIEPSQGSETFVEPGYEPEMGQSSGRGTNETINPNEFDDFLDIDWNPFFEAAKSRGASTNEDTMVNDKGKQVCEDGDERQEGDEHEDSDDHEGGDDHEDSDFIVDEDNVINEVEVDMSDFNSNIDEDVEFMGCINQTTGTMESVNEIVHLDVLNNDSFESASDDDDGGIDHLRRKKLRELTMQGQSGSSGSKDGLIHLGQTFGNKKEIKELIKIHSIETRRKLKIIKDDKERVRAVCEGFLPSFSNLDICGSSNTLVETSVTKNKVRPVKESETKKEKVKGKEQNLKKVDDGAHKGGRGKKGNKHNYLCPWVLHVSKIKGSETWMVKTFIDEHKCLQSREIKACTAGYLSKKIVEQVESNPDIPARALQIQLQKELQLGISKMKAFRAKKAANGQLKGDYTEQYAILRDYIDELIARNPGTTVHVNVEPGNPKSKTRVFKRIYVCLGALKQGFKALGRELIGLDGAFMSGPFPGQLLTAVSMDSNNGIYPVAYAVVEAENKESWSWFLQCLGDDLDLEKNSNFTFISDRQKGILPAIATLFPCAEHRFCLRHIHENMKLKWKGKAYKNLLWNCATSTTVPYFHRAMDELRKFNEESYKWLSKVPPHHWSRSHFSGRAKSDVLLNNMCEVLNRHLVDGRHKPIIDVLEYTREYLMKRIVNVSKVIDKCEGPLTPTATKMLELIKTEAAKYTCVWNGGQKYQVSGPWGNQCVVDIEHKECSCRRWELTGMPCKHVVASIWNMALNGMEVGIPETWCDPVYWLDTWKKVYSFKINPVNGKTMWAKSRVPTILTPPKYHKPIGRPKKQRRKTADELESMNKRGKLSRSLKTVTCSKCGGAGHNSRKCTGQGGSESQGGSKGLKRKAGEGSSVSNNPKKFKKTVKEGTKAPKNVGTVAAKNGCRKGLKKNNDEGSGK